MNFLVCISKTPDTTSKISFKNNDTEYNTDGVNFIMNPYDEWYALVKAIELNEKDGGSVTVINVGNASNDIIIRKALAIGANAAVRIDSDTPDAYFVAAQIAAHAKEKEYDAIFTGKETIDYNGADVGAMIAEMLDWPFVSFATHLDFNGGIASVTRDIEGGEELCEISGKFVLSAAKGLAQQRIPNMKGIMMAKSKPLEIIAPIPVKAKVETVKFETPPAKSGVKLLEADQMDELVRLLHEEAKVI